MRPLFLLIILFSFVGLNAQNNHVFFEENTIQRSHINPALINEMKFSISTGLMADVFTNGVKYDNILTSDKIIKEDDYLQSIDKEFNIFGDYSINYLDAYYNFGKLGISAGGGRRILGGGTVPKELFDLYYKGNEPFIGKEIIIQPILSGQDFTQYYIGLHTNLGKVDIALRGKFLNGRSAVNIEGSDLSLTTSDDIYQLSFKGSSTFNYLENSPGNSGLALDIGLSYPINESTYISVSMVDIGSINYEGGNNYSVNGDSEFAGLDLVNYIKDEEKIDLEDTIKSFIGYDESNDPFSVVLPSKLNLGVNHVISDKSSIGILLNTRFLNNKTQSTIALNYSRKILPFLKGSVLYSARQNSYTNLGLLFSLEVGPVHAFVSTDDVIGLIIKNNRDQGSLGLGLAYKI